MGVSKNRGTPKSSILIGFSIINHPFWGTSIFGNTHIDMHTLMIICMCFPGTSKRNCGKGGWKKPVDCRGFAMTDIDKLVQLEKALDVYMCIYIYL